MERRGNASGTERRRAAPATVRRGLAARGGEDRSKESTTGVKGEAGSLERPARKREARVEGAG